MNHEPKPILPVGTLFLVALLAFLFGRPFADFHSTWSALDTLKAIGIITVVDATLFFVWYKISKKKVVRDPSFDQMVRKGWDYLIVSVVIIAPLLEEFICRYLIVGALYDWSPVVAIGASGLIFGYVHVSMPFPKAIMGVVYAGLYVMSGTLWAPILAHAVWNAGALYLARKSINRKMREMPIF